MNNIDLVKLGQKLRVLVLKATTKVGSGHPSSCLSAVEMISVLAFGGYLQEKDHLLFSKGHAAPLLYALMVEQGKITEAQLMTLRQLNSPVEGHPVPGLPGVEVATGSLGQGLSIGVGMVLADQKLSQNQNRTYVLLGDGELEEGSVWEAVNLAGYYRLSHLTALVDVNRLEQDGETILGWDLVSLSRRFAAFGWQTQIVTDGHNLSQIEAAFSTKADKPKVIIAKTVKGKGVSLLENQPNWHGKVLNKQQLNQALKELDFAIVKDVPEVTLMKTPVVEQLLTKLIRLSND